MLIYLDAAINLLDFMSSSVIENIFNISILFLKFVASNFLTDSKLDVVIVSLICWSDIEHCVKIIHNGVSHMPSIELDLCGFEDSYVASQAGFSQSISFDEQFVEIYPHFISNALVVIPQIQYKVSLGDFTLDSSTRRVEIAQTSMGIVAIKIPIRVEMRSQSKIRHEIFLWKVQIRKLRVINDVSVWILKLE